MRVITQSCVLFLWMHTLTFVKSQDCTLAQFVSGSLYDSNFDITELEPTYSNDKQVRVSCNIGFTGFFKLICKAGEWTSRGTKCQPRSCGHPGDAQFSDFHLDKGDDFVFGSQVIYTCHKGYQMVSRRNYRLCRAKGWDGVVPVCEALQCPVIRVEANVMVTGDPEESTYGNVLRFSCKFSSEIPDGVTEIHCDENGQWSGKAPKCIEIKCEVPEIKNGYVNGHKQTYAEGEVLHFDCNRKYRRAENRPVKCIKTGNKAEFIPSPECESIKCRLTQTAIGGVVYEPARSVFTPGETLTVSCDDRHWVFNPGQTSHVFTCREDGTWVTQPVCKAIICNDPRDTNINYWSVSSWQQKRLDDTADYSCIRGYKKTGGTRLATCTRSGWMPNPLCEARTCDRKDVENAEITSKYQDTYSYSNQVRYACKEGFTGEFTLTCWGNGWHGDSRCQEKPCERIEIPDAQTSSWRTRFNHNERVEYSCNNDVERRFEITCGPSGWTGIQSCPAITCDREDFENAEITWNNKDTYSYRDYVRYACKDGFTGEFTRTCTENGWHGNPRCQEKPCERIEIPDAQTSSPRTRFNHNERVQYFCNNDVDRLFTITCGPSGWTGIQSCTECQQPKIQNGFAVGPHDGTLYYTCDEGFKFSTKGWWQVAKCNKGRWDRLKPCIDNRKCGEIPVILNAEPPPSTHDHNEGHSVTIQCKDGYRADVTHMRCHAGEWQIDVPSLKTICTPIANYCGPPPKVENAVILTPHQAEYLSNSRVAYQCRDQYTMDVDNSIRCNNGKWEMNKMACIWYCSKPDDATKTMTFTVDKDNYPNGEVIEYQCPDSGEKIEGRATCVDGVWSQPIECKAPTQEPHHVERSKEVPM